MELLQSTIGLVGVIFGAVLSGIGFYLKARIERKRAISLALADLLEVRHQISIIKLVDQELSKRFNFPPEDTLVLQTLISQMLPINTDIHIRYDSAVTILAGIDPLLAFKLRAKNTLPKILEHLRVMGESSGVSRSTIVNVLDTLRDNLLPELDKAVIELASHYSFFTKKKVIKIIDSTKTMPHELNFMFDEIEKLAK